MLHSFTKGPTGICKIFTGIIRITFLPSGEINARSTSLFNDILGPIIEFVMVPPYKFVPGRITLSEIMHFSIKEFLPITTFGPIIESEIFTFTSI